MMWRAALFLLASLVSAGAQTLPDPEQSLIASWNLLSGNVGRDFPSVQAALGAFIKEHDEMALRLKWYEADDKALRALVGKGK